MPTDKSTIETKAETKAKTTQTNSNIQPANSSYDLELFEHNPAILVRWTPQLKPRGICIYYISKNIYQLGYSVDEIISGEVQWTDLMHPDDTDNTFNKVFEASMSGVVNYQVKYRFKAKTGEYRWIHDNSTVVRNSNGHVIAFQSVLIDITDMKQVELELKQKSSYLQGLYEVSLQLDNNLDLQQICELLLKKLATLSRNNNTYISLVDKQESILEYVAGTGLYEQVVGYKQTKDKGIIGAVYSSKEAVFCKNYQESEYAFDTSAMFSTIRTVVTLPMINSGEVIGVIGFATEDDRDVDDTTVELLNSFARLAAVTIDNLNLHSKVKREVIRNESLFAISEAVHDSDRLDLLMDNIVEHVRKALGARWAMMYKIDTTNHSVENVSTTLNKEDGNILKILSYEELHEGLGGWAIENKKAGYSLKGTTDARESDQINNRMTENDIGSVLVVPFLYNGKVQGTIATINHIDDRNFNQSDVELIGFIANQIGVAVAKSELQRKIEHQAYHDVLTGLPNRLLFEVTAEKVLARAKRNNSHFGVVFIDLDGFKHVNDTLGHDIGDLLLKEVADKLNSRTRTEDTLARMGGDEFALILTDLDTQEEAIKIAQHHLNILQKEIVIMGFNIRIGASIGISLFPNDGQDLQTLLKNADSAMYQTKNSGKNGVSLFTKSLAKSTQERAELETDLKFALERGELELNYQPQYNLKSGERIGVEALLRWYHPTKGSISPAKFIPIAEESNLIVDIGTWVLNEACRQNAVWQANGFEAITMAVNISSKQFERDDFVDIVIAALKDSGLPSEYLELEVTESVVMHDTATVIERLTLLRKLNITIAIDDFGTGYSSLQYLQDLPLDKLKIDKSFVDKVSKDNEAPLVKTILNLSKNLNLKTVAEGIETEEQLLVLNELGADEGQGYYFSKPLKASELYPDILDATTTNIESNYLS